MSFELPKDVIMLELKRMQMFVRTVLLNRPDLLRNHKDLLDNVVNLATEQINRRNTVILPCISFGQFPLPGGKQQRLIQLALIMDTSLNMGQVENSLKKIEELFGKLIKSSKIDTITNKSAIILEIALDSKVAFFLARNMGKLTDISIRSVLVGSLGFDKQDKFDKQGNYCGNQPFRHAMYPAYNRIYSLGAVDEEVGFVSTGFHGSLDRGGEPYYCPNGWRRFAIDVGMTGSEFDRAYGKWHVAYHGTKGTLAMEILTTGLLASGQGIGCYIEGTKGAVYLSPSIEYCGHPRYAQVWKIKSKYIQMVLQVRVNKRCVFNKKNETLRSQANPLDPNFKNNELEWVIQVPPKMLITSDDILVYGIMLRVTDKHPGYLPQNAWWDKDAFDKSIRECGD